MPQTAAQTKDTPHRDQSMNGLYRHTKRTDWGLAQCLWARDGKRGFQFEDGSVRAFSDQFVHLFEKVPGSDSVDSLVVSEHQAPSLDDQISVFAGAFPQGFATEQWVHHHRGRPNGRRLKRHRSPALEQAAAEASATQLRKLLDATPRAAVDAVADVLAETDLVTKAHVQTLRKLGEDQDSARALVEFIHGKSELAERFAELRSAWARRKLRGMSWNLVTAVLALSDPNTHLYVRPATVRAQAKILGMKVPTGSSADAAGYPRFVAVAEAVATRLRQRGYPPHDLLDVADFMSYTLRHSARPQLEQQARQRIFGTRDAA